MNYLVDTHVLSELRCKTPHPRVVHWFAAHSPRSLYLSVLTLGEIRQAIEEVQDKKRRLALVEWLESDLPAFFAGRILNLDPPITHRWGRLLAQTRRNLPTIDSLLAATALEHGLSLVTRQVKDFKGIPVTILNPWGE